MLVAKEVEMGHKKIIVIIIIILIIINDIYIALNLEALSALQLNTVFLTVEGLR